MNVIATNGIEMPSFLLDVSPSLSSLLLVLGRVRERRMWLRRGRGWRGFRRSYKGKGGAAMRTDGDEGIRRNTEESSKNMVRAHVAFSGVGRA